MSEYIITREQIEELNNANGGMQILTSWLSAYAVFDTSEFPPLMKSQHLAITLPNVVRCKDCAHWATEARFTGMCVGKQLNPDGFCSWGVRREP